MATDQESNNLDDFDIEQVINWEEHNYASKNLDIQHLPDLDLSSDLPITCTASVVPPGHAAQPQASHGRTMLLNNQVIATHQQPQRDQSSSITRPLSQTSNSVLNPVFPQDASYMISDIRQELTRSRQIPDAPRDVQPSFPSENFDVPSISHQRPHPTSGSQVLNFIPGHDQHLNTQRVVTASQLGHSISRHPSLHNGMQRFNQTGMPANMSNVNEPMNPDLDNEDGGSSSIDQLIEDIVDRDMPQGVGDTVVFSTHDVALGGQHQQIHHVMASSASQLAPNLTSSKQNPNQIPGIARNSPAICTSTGSPLPVTGQVSAGNIAHVHSPLPQNPASPIIAKAPSPQMQQYKAAPMRSGRGNTKKTVTIPTQQQPHSPQNLAIGVAHSPRSAPQRSPQNAPQRSPQNVQQRSPQQPSGQSPPASVNSVMSQNMPSPMSQASPMSSGGMQNISSQVMGSIGMQHSPVASPLNIPSPQTQRSSRQASPGSCNIGSPIAGAPVALSQVATQNYMTQGNQAKVNIQNTGNTRVSVSKPNPSVTGSAIYAPVQNSGTNVWSQSQFIPRQSTNSNKGALSPGIPAQQAATIQAKPAATQQTNANSSGQPVSTFDTETVLRGLTALKGTNVIPFQLKQGTGQQLQAVKLPQSAAGMDLLKQAMLVKAGQGNGAQPTGKPMTINTSQGQVICYILPKQTGNNNNQPTAATQGQQVKMLVLTTSNISSGSNIVKTVNSSTSSTTVLPSNVNIISSVNPVFANNTTTSIPVQQNVSKTSTLHQSPMQAMTSVVKAVGEDSNASLSIPNPRQGISTASGQNSLVQGPSMADIATQSVDTTRITFVNESTCVDHLVSAPGLGQSASSIITTHPLTSTVSTTATKTTPATSSTTPVLVGDSDDSDTPLAVLAETLRKTNGEEKKKKKKKKAEKRKKREKSGTEKPLPAFQIFFKETQAAIRQQNPSIDFDNVTKIVNQMWEKLPEDQKKVYYAKHEKAKKDHEKALEKLKQEPSSKIRKLEASTVSPLSSPKTSVPVTASSTTTTSTKESPKQESITLKIPKSMLNKAEPVPKIPKIAAAAPTTKIIVSSSTATTISPVKKKSKVSINPIAQRICIRDGCNMPARTTKERGTQYCSNECIVTHCRNVFQSWVTKRKEEAIQVS